MDKKEIRSIATAINTLDKKGATIASRLFEVLKPAINSNDKACLLYTSDAADE